MEKGEKILRKLYGDVDISERDIEVANRVLGSYIESGPRSGMLPAKFVVVGEVVSVGGFDYRCYEAPVKTCPADACLGCDFSLKYRNCSSVQCSPFDRKDGLFVWFEELEGVR